MESDFVYIGVVGSRRPELTIKQQLRFFVV